ncbi:MAG: hypothetical protein K6F54_11315 [Lachnospiraceae bacterium]|nr:hypothetical protein [Lachnospiraceae bacterium]
MAYKFMEDAFLKNSVDNGSCDYCGAKGVRVVDVIKLRDCIIEDIEKGYTHTEDIEGFHDDLDGTYIDLGMIDGVYGRVHDLPSPISIHRIIESDYDELNADLLEDIFDGYEELDWEDYIYNSALYD